MTKFKLIILKYLINRILQFDTNHSKIELYTMTCIQLSQIKDELLMLDSANLKPECIIELV